jgi:hypothetical protein
VSPSRKRFFLTLIVIAIGLLILGVYYTQTVRQEGRTRFFDQSSSSHPVELRRSGGEWILVDPRRKWREGENTRYLNPVVLSHDQLVQQSEERWGQRNEWLSFRELYRNYYRPYYRERFDTVLKATNPEVERAYEFWKRKRAEESRTRR